MCYTPYSSCGIRAPIVLGRDFTAWCAVLNEFYELYTRNHVCTGNGGDSERVSAETQLVIGLFIAYS